MIVVSEEIDDRIVNQLLECGFRRRAGAHSAWQARLNRRIIDEGTWHECAAHADDAIAYAHNHESLYGMTTSEGVEALLKLGAQAREDEPVAVNAYGLSVRPKRGQDRQIRIPRTWSTTRQRSPLQPPTRRAGRRPHKAGSVARNPGGVVTFHSVNHSTSPSQSVSSSRMAA